MTIKVGINGFGRIGRCTLSHIAASGRKDIEVVKLNATGPLDTAAHLLRYDSVHGRFPGDVRTEDGYLNLGQNDIEVMSSYRLEELDWSGCDVVLECTGQFNDGDRLDEIRLAKQFGVSRTPIREALQRLVASGLAEQLPRRGDLETPCQAPASKSPVVSTRSKPGGTAASSGNRCRIS